MALDFTLAKYRKLCEAMANYEILTFKDYLTREDLPDRYAILRHDVDRKPRSALTMAEIEAELGIHATYYFRMRSGTFRPEIIEKITAMGHEVGYHYEALDKAKGDYQKAREIFEDELGRFTMIADVKTICMHGNPLTRWDNRDLWQRYDFRNYGILGEAYLSLRDKVHYFTDTGRSWNSKHRVKDRLQDELNINLNIDTTDDLVRFIRGDSIAKIYILVHPERWSQGRLEWLSYYLVDMVTNLGKRVVFKLVSYKS